MHQKETSYLRDYEFYCEEEVNMPVQNELDLASPWSTRPVDTSTNYPIFFDEAEKSLKWRHAMDQDISSIEKTQTCILSHQLQGE
ncbi:hypothetical protein Bca4012_071643 [Brassica carinata]